MERGSPLLGTPCHGLPWEDHACRAPQRATVRGRGLAEIARSRGRCANDLADRIRGLSGAGFLAPRDLLDILSRPGTASRQNASPGPVWRARNEILTFEGKGGGSRAGGVLPRG